MAMCVDHINIVCGDLDRAVRFYAEGLGLRESRRAVLEGAWIDAIVGLEGVRAEVVFLEFPEGGPRLELIAYENPAGQALPATSAPNTRGLRHIAIRVADMDAARARIEAAGAQLFGPPVTVPEGVVRHDAGRKRLCYFLDPEGVLLELAEYRDAGRH